MARLFKRIIDLISANINDWLDRSENPERMVKHSILKMEENIAKVKDSVVGAIASEKRLRKELDDNYKRSSDWLAKAERALGDGNEELARSALARKQEHDAICKMLAPACEAARNTSDKLKAQLNALEAKLAAAKRDHDSLAARQYAAEANQQMDKTLADFEAGINAQAKFQHMENRVLEMETRAEALVEIRDGRTQLERDFLALESRAEIEDELQMLKQKMARKLLDHRP